MQQMVKNRGHINGALHLGPLGGGKLFVLIFNVKRNFDIKF